MTHFLQNVARKNTKICKKIEKTPKSQPNLKLISKPLKPLIGPQTQLSSARSRYIVVTYGLQVFLVITNRPKNPHGNFLLAVTGF